MPFAHRACRRCGRTSSPLRRDACWPCHFGAPDGVDRAHATRGERVVAFEERRERSDRRRATGSTRAPAAWMSAIVRLLYEERRERPRRVAEA